MQLIERERVTSAGGVPTIAWQIIEHPARPAYDLSSLESMAYGGAPAAPELVRRIREVFPTSAPGIGAHAWGPTHCASPAWAKRWLRVAWKSRTAATLTVR